MAARPGEQPTGLFSLRRADMSTSNPRANRLLPQTPPPSNPCQNRYNRKGSCQKRSSHREYNQIQTGIALSSDEKRAPKFLSEFFFYTVINRHDSKVSQFLYYTHAYTVSDMDRLVRPFRNVYKSQIPYASKILLPAGFPRCPLIHLRNRCPQTVFMDTIKL